MTKRKLVATENDNKDSAKIVKLDPQQINYVLPINIEIVAQIKDLEITFSSLYTQISANRSENLTTKIVSTLEELYQLHYYSTHFSNIYSFLNTSTHGKTYFGYMVEFEVTNVLNNVKELLDIVKIKFGSNRYDYLLSSLSHCPGDLPVHTYAKTGNIEKLTALMEKNDSNYAGLLPFIFNVYGDIFYQAIANKQLTTAQLIFNKNWYKSSAINYLRISLNKQANFDDLSVQLIDKISACDNSGQIIKNYKYNNGNNLAHIAAACGQLESLKKLIEINPDFINSEGEHKFTPIACSVSMGQKDTYAHLIEKGAKLDLVFEYNQTLLHLAIFSKQQDIALELIEKHYSDCFDNKYRGKNCLEFIINLISSQKITNQQSLNDYLPIIKALYVKEQSVNKKYTNNFKTFVTAEKNPALDAIKKVLNIYTVDDIKAIFGAVEDHVNTDATSNIDEYVHKTNLSGKTNDGLPFETEFGC